MPEGAYDYDAETIASHLRNALDLISYHDTQDRAVTPPVGRKSQITPNGPGKWLVRVIDGRPWSPGRPESGEPRYYDLTVTVTPRQSAAKADSAQP
jgi:hypothetical protein